MNRRRLLFVLTLTIALFLLNPMTADTGTRTQATGQNLPDEIILKLFTSTDLAGVASDYALDPTPLDQFGTRAIYRMRILDGGLPSDRAAALTGDLRVVYAEPNFIGQAPEGQQQVSWAKGDEEETYTEQWAVNTIRLLEAHTVTRGAGVIVAVLDTGIAMNHPALTGKMVSGYDFVDLDADPGEEGDPDENPLYGHGTHVAGLIALVAPEARIMPLRVLDSDGMGNIWVLAEALAYAMNPDQDPNTDDGADVINLSLSSSHPTNLLADIVATITCDDDEFCPHAHQGAVVVTAAGNNSSGLPEFPASEGVAGSLAVGASTSDDTLAPFSNFGSWVHLTAPGANILSTVPGNEYGVWSGTSMAAPLVAGQAALVRAAYPAFDPATVVTKILSTAEHIGGLVPLRIDVATAVGVPIPYIPGEFLCNEPLGVVKVDGIKVSSGHTCILTGTRVLGNIKVETGGTLIANLITVNGNLQADKAGAISIHHAEIGGNLQLVEGNMVNLSTSDIHGDVQVFKHTDSITLSGNTIGGNLQCKDNHHAATGSGNTVLGNSEDQCAGF